jgi:YggT family protein
MARLPPEQHCRYKASAFEGTKLMFFALRTLLIAILDLYWWVVIIAVVLSWLVGFGVINTYNQVARTVVRAFHALTEPVFAPIRRIIPPFGGLDLSPLIVLFAIFFFRNWLVAGTFF